MASLYTQIVGAIALVLGLGWVIAPRRMIDWQYRILYFWSDTSPTEHANETAGRVGGILLAAVGAALAAGVVP